MWIRDRDFTEAKEIGKEIEADFEQLTLTGGYDHNFVLDKEEGKMDWMAKVACPETGIRMEAFTDCPAVEFYTGNFIEGSPLGKNGILYKNRSAVCLETQFLPNAINCPDFPSPILHVGEVYRHRTVYQFKTI